VFNTDCSFYSRERRESHICFIFTLAESIHFWLTHCKSLPTFLSNSYASWLSVFRRIRPKLTSNKRKFIISKICSLLFVFFVLIYWFFFPPCLFLKLKLIAISSYIKIKFSEILFFFHRINVAKLADAFRTLLLESTMLTLLFDSNLYMWSKPEGAASVLYFKTLSCWC